VISYESLFNPRASFDNPYQYIGNFFKFIHVTYFEKYKELLGDFIDAVNARRYLSAALSGRSLIEATASLRYYNFAVRKRVRISAKKDLDGIDLEFLREAFELANKHMHGSRMDWRDFFTSDKKTFVSKLVENEKRRLKKEPPLKREYIQSYPVSKFLDSWFDDEPELVAMTYNFFSELVHPNLGSNLLLIGISDGEIQVGSESNRAVGKIICREAVTFIAPILKEAAKQLADSVLLSSMGDPIEPTKPTD
jgi:hypothetical protein